MTDCELLVILQGTIWTSQEILNDVDFGRSEYEIKIKKGIEENLKEVKKAMIMWGIKHDDAGVLLDGNEYNITRRKCAKDGLPINKKDIEDAFKKWDIDVIVYENSINLIPLWLRLNSKFDVDIKKLINYFKKYINEAEEINKAIIPNESILDYRYKNL
jgi:hypothetical protein|nr:MAG TPA: hypothetical protein [Caudoviricetes sp.]